MLASFDQIQGREWRNWPSWAQNLKSLTQTALLTSKTSDQNVLATKWGWIYFTNIWWLNECGGGPCFSEPSEGQLTSLWTPEHLSLCQTSMLQMLCLRNVTFWMLNCRSMAKMISCVPETSLDSAVSHFVPLPSLLSQILYSDCMFEPNALCKTSMIIELFCS